MYDNKAEKVKSKPCRKTMWMDQVKQYSDMCLSE